MIKYVIIYASMFCSFISHANTQYKSVECIPAAVELYFEQNVSAEIEAFVHEVASKIDFTPKITVVHPSLYAQETFPSYKVIVAIQAPQLIVSVNEQWFNSLTEDEKFFGIALQLMNQQPSHEREVFKKKVEKIRKIWNGVEYIAELGAFTGIYYAVHNHDSIELAGRAISLDNWKKKAGLSLAAMLALELALWPVHYGISRWEAKKTKQIINARFEKWVRKYSSIDAAIQYLTKISAELGMQTNETLEFLYTLKK